MTGRKHVVIHFNPAWRPYLRRVAQGLARYVHQHTDWRLTPLVLFDYKLDAERYRPLSQPPIDGMVTGISPEFVEQVRANPQPKVLVGPEAMGLGMPWVGPDYRQVGRLGAQDLLHRGARSLILFRHGDPDRHDTRLIEQGFTEVAQRRGVTYTVFSNGPRTQQRGTWRYADQQADFIDLLHRTEPPIGILCSDDDHGWRALECCELAAMRVPDAVTVLGIGGDEFICELATPMLSSIRVDFEAVGYLVGQTLDDQFHGKEVPLVQTAGLPEVVPRQSTGYVATDDPQVAGAIRFIHENFDQPLTTDDIAAAVHAGSRTLMRRFKAQLNRTPSEELRRQRVERALYLIRSTDQPLAQVALDCGFGQQSALGRAVKAATGRTPGQLRRE